MDKMNKNTTKYIVIIIILLIIGGIFYFNGDKGITKEENLDILVPKEGDDADTTKIKETIKTNACGDEDKDCYNTYLQLGFKYETAGDLQSALSSYIQASKIAPKEYVPYSNMGSVYRQQKDFLKAEESLKKALELDPTALSVYTKLYEVYRYDLKKYPHEIMPFFADALQKTNNDFGVILLYAGYLYDVNDYGNALVVWKSLAQAFPENTSYKQKVDYLQEKVDAEQKATSGQ